MWRQNAFPGDQDSDQSISDEELNGEFGESFSSLNTNTKREQGLLLQSRLEILRGNDNKQSGFFVEDEVEIPDFPNEGGLVSSAEKDAYGFLESADNPSASRLQNNSNLNTFRSKKHVGARTWSMISTEADVLIGSDDNAFSSASGYSNTKSCKGSKGKVKPKFSLCSKLQKDGLPQRDISISENVMPSSDLGMPERMQPIENETLDDSNLEFLEEFCEENDQKLQILPAEVETLGKGHIKHSMAELLDGLQDKNVVLRGNTKMSRRTRSKTAQVIVKRSMSPLKERIIDSEEEPELVSSGSSGEDEVDYQNFSLSKLAMKKQTVADQVQEALDAASFSNDGVHIAAAKFSGIGLFGRLQQVMQREKEMDADFLKRMQMEPIPYDYPHYIVVKILLRCLDAKLIVCHCSFSKNLKGLELPDGSRMLAGRGERTVIFSPRVCSDVDLDVGNLICIHPPWKEVQAIGRDESVILATYFSHF